MAFNKTQFFDNVRTGLLGPTLQPNEVSGCDAIIDAMTGTALSLTAYALATAYHETAHTMQPIKELGGQDYFRRRYGIEGNNPKLARQLGNTEPGDGVRYCGRGYVQLTGRTNYTKVSNILTLDMINNPDLAMVPAYAATIMRRGMEEGWFTGKSFATYLPVPEATRSQFHAARRIINGMDKAAALIASYALQFQQALIAGQWP